MKIAGDLRCADREKTRRLKLVGQRCVGQLLDCLLQVTLTQRYRLDTEEIEAVDAAAASRTEEGVAIPSHLQDQSSSVTADECAGGSTGQKNDREDKLEAHDPKDASCTDDHYPGLPDQSAPSLQAHSVVKSPLAPQKPEEVFYWLAVNTEEAVVTHFECQSDEFHLRREVVGAADLAKWKVAVHRDKLRAGHRSSTGAKAGQASSRNKLRTKSLADVGGVSELASARRFVRQLNLPPAEAEALSDVIVRCYCIPLGRVWPWRDVEVSVTYAAVANVVQDWIQITLPTGVHDLSRYCPHRRRLKPTLKSRPTVFREEATSVAVDELAAHGEKGLDKTVAENGLNGSDAIPDPYGDGEVTSANNKGDGQSAALGQERKIVADGTAKAMDEIKLKRFSSGVEYGISLSLKAIVPGDVTSLLSPSHSQYVTVRTYGSDSHRAAVEYGPDVDAPPRHIDLKVQHTRNSRPCATLLEKPSNVGVGPAVMLSIAAPNFARAHALLQSGSTCHIGEFVFMVDQSGSMATTFPSTAPSTHRVFRGKQSVNSFMDQAKSTLMLFLHSLPPFCFFNIIGFGSRRLRLFKKSEVYNDDTLKEARKHVSGLTNNLGGTDLLRPLAEVLDAKPAVEGVPRCVFVLTDGAVGSEDTAEVFRKVRCHARSTRIFSLGIGTSAGRHLVRGLAHFGNGLYSFITSPTQDMTEVVIKQLKEALRPPLMAPVIDWGELGVQYQHPTTDCLVPVCPGRPYTVFAVLKPASPRRGRVKLKGIASGERLEEDVAVQLTQTDSRNGWKFLHQYAAAMHLAERQRAAEDMFAAAPRLERNKLMALENEAMAFVSVQYQVFSHSTTELLLDLMSTSAAKEKFSGAKAMGYVHLQPRTDKASDPASVGSKPAPTKTVKRSLSTPAVSSASSSTLVPADEAVDPVHRLTKLQLANGMWFDGISQVAELLFIDSDSLAHGYGCETYTVLKGMPSLPGKDREAVWTTLVVLSFLRTHCPSHTETLHMITEKAKGAVAATLLAAGIVETFPRAVDFVNLQLNCVAEALKQKPQL